MTCTEERSLILSLSFVLVKTSIMIPPPLFPSGACDADWITQGSDCYKVMMLPDPEYYVNTYAARQACLAVGADLASIPDTTIQDELYTAIRALVRSEGERGG
jgi:hypothetical protein